MTVITPDPKTSGNGRLSVLAAWGAVVSRGGSEEDAREFLRQLYQHVYGLGQGARDASTTFALAKEGDVHLTWENEAIREAQQSGGELEVIYPPVSIRAEPSVAWVDANAAKHESATAAKAYLEFLFTDETQEFSPRMATDPATKRSCAGIGTCCRTSSSFRSRSSPRIGMMPRPNSSATAASSV